MSQRISVALIFGALTIRCSGSAVVPVFTAGTSGYACFRVPGAVRSPSGDLLVFAEARRTSCADQAPKDVALSRSSDGGKTWSSPVRVVGDGLGNTTFRNPYPVFSAEGDLVVQFVNSTSEVWESLQVVSTDDGRTWGAITSNAGGLGTWNGVLGGPGAAILLGSSSPGSRFKGRLLGCGAGRYDPAFFTTASTSFFSDDGGASWRVSNQSFPKDTAECQVAELPNASVVINFRVEPPLPCHCRLQARSDDGGESWSSPTPVPALVEPICSAGLLQASGSLLFSNPATTSSRVNMTVRRSGDEGSTWTAGTALVWPGPAAYSVLVPLSSPGTQAGTEVYGPVTVGVVFECGEKSPYETISFSSVTV